MPNALRSGQGDRFDIVAIASSAGGITALAEVLGVLTVAFPVPVLIVQHLDPRHETVLADVLGRRTALNVKLAEHGEVAHPGWVFAAPPDRHLLVDQHGKLTLSAGEPVHFSRPSADVMFTSVAGAYGARSIGCVLTGAGSDGAMGLAAIKSRGGTVIAQDPASAEFKGMPSAAVEAAAVDFVLPPGEIGGVVSGLVGAMR